MRGGAFQATKGTHSSVWGEGHLRSWKGPRPGWPEPLSPRGAQGDSRRLLGPPGLQPRPAGSPRCGCRQPLAPAAAQAALFAQRTPGQPGTPGGGRRARVVVLFPGAQPRGQRSWLTVPWSPTPPRTSAGWPGWTLQPLHTHAHAHRHTHTPQLGLCVGGKAVSSGCTPGRPGGAGPGLSPRPAPSWGPPPPTLPAPLLCFLSGTSFLEAQRGC